jgi:hypothetical protein
VGDRSENYGLLGVGVGGQIQGLLGVGVQEEPAVSAVAPIDGPVDPQSDPVLGPDPVGVQEVIPGAQEPPQVAIGCQHSSDLADRRSSGRFWCLRKIKDSIFKTIFGVEMFGFIIFYINKFKFIVEMGFGV